MIMANPISNTPAIKKSKGDHSKIPVNDRARGIDRANAANSAENSHRFFALFAANSFISSLVLLQIDGR